MPSIRLRPLRSDDLAALSAGLADDGGETPFAFFGFRGINTYEKRFAENGMITETSGSLAIEAEQSVFAGTVGWFAVQHGPSPSARALNIGIELIPQQRGRGYGTAAQIAIADYLFSTTLIERLEAGTDVDNLAEQRALEKAGFLREGVLRHAQFRAGEWHDLVQFSRLRGDPSPAS